MKYLRARRECRRALRENRAARAELRAATDTMIGIWSAHPVPVLASAAGVGFLLAKLRVGRGIIRTGMQIATGPGWRLLRQYFPI